MTVLRNNLDTGPHGTTITVANSNDLAGNDSLDLIGTVGSGVIAEYSNTFARPTGAFTGHFKTGATAGAPGVAWSTSMGSQSQIWFRFYALITAYPSTATDPCYFESDNGAVYGCFVTLEGGGSGRFQIINSPQTVSLSFTEQVALGSWYRLEGRVQYSATTGNFELRLFNEADSDEPSEVISGTNWNFGASTVNSWAFGYPVSHTNMSDLYFSGLELNNVGWPGPAPFKQHGVPGILTNPTAVHSDTR